MENKTMDEFKEIEKQLKNYKNYKIGIQNMQKQLRYYFPSITSPAEFREGSSGTFTFHSGTEEFAIKRVDKAIEIQEEIDKYRLLLDSVDAALKPLKPIEREYVDMKYFQELSIKQIADNLGYSIPRIYQIREAVKEQFLISLKCLIQ